MRFTFSATKNSLIPYQLNKIRKENNNQKVYDNLSLNPFKSLQLNQYQIIFDNRFSLDNWDMCAG